MDTTVDPRQPNPYDPGEDGHYATLPSYPFPEGMDIPRLMPFQEQPFNGDHHLAAEVLRLKEAHNLTDAFETGTCLGSTTLWLWEHVTGHTRTCETHRPFFDIAVQRVVNHVGRHMAADIGSSDVWFGGHGRDGDPPSGQLWFCASDVLIRRLTTNLQWAEEHGRKHFFFLDAHPMTGTGEEGYATVLKELEAIADSKTKPCIVVHDMQVPGLPEAGWDTYNGQPFTLEWIKPYLDRIYGEGGWRHNYPMQVAGAKRGWISVEPC